MLNELKLSWWANLIKNLNIGWKWDKFNPLNQNITNIESKLSGQANTDFHKLNSKVKNIFRKKYQTYINAELNSQS